MDFSSIIAIAAPLVGEAVGLFARLRTAKAEERAAIVARLADALSAMQAAKVAERSAHEARTAETRRIIDGGAEGSGSGERPSAGFSYATVLVDPDKLP